MNWIKVGGSAPLSLYFSLIKKIIRDESSEIGGIAQLVERQLCKLDVRGSTPLASTKVSDDEKVVGKKGKNFLELGQ